MPRITRQEVYLAIDTEREYQDVLSPDRREAREMTIGEELVLLKEYLDRTFREWTDAPGIAPLASLNGVRKIAAIAVRAMENHGAPPRVNR
jgi:hypothetical protein